MTELKAFPYLCFVRFDLICKEFDRQFNTYFDDHIHELSERPGYGPAWRTREIRDADNAGFLEQEYQQLYTIMDPALFQSFPQDPPPPVPIEQPHRRDMSNWGRVFYHVLGFFENDPRNGRCLARMELNFKGPVAAQKRTKFQR